MDAFLSILFVLILGGIIYYNIYDSYFYKKPKVKPEEENKEEQQRQQESILSEQIDKFIEKDRQVLTNKNWEKSYNQLNAEQLLKIGSLEKQILEVSEQKKKVTSQKKSSEVRLGHIAETLAPFLEQFEFDPETCTFMGRPIDYISFGDDEITFIEVKSGKSQLSAKQRHIRDLVNNKLVAWKEVRIK